MIGEKTAGKKQDRFSDQYYMASSWKLMWRRFTRHRLAVLGGAGLLVLYMGAIFSGFFSTNNIHQRHNDYVFAPPQRVRIVHEGSLRWPFVYGYESSRDPVTLRMHYVPDSSTVYPIRFFGRGFEYEFWGLFKARFHFISVEEPGVLFLAGTDSFGRCMFSRVVYASRISLSVGLLGVLISFAIATFVGGVSGYFGGAVDMFIQRFDELIGGIPTLPLWMVLSVIVPPFWPPVRVYFGITLILSVVGAIGGSRMVRSKLIQLREEEYVLAARIAGTSSVRIIIRHLIPAYASFLIVSLTLAIPGMILGETSLSFLGVGLRPPVVSWGVLLKQAQNVRTVALHPWLMLPVFMVIVTVLSFNFMGDGLRDAADPYSVQ